MLSVAVIAEPIFLTHRVSEESACVLYFALERHSDCVPGKREESLDISGQNVIAVHGMFEQPLNAGGILEVSRFNPEWPATKTSDPEFLDSLNAWFNYRFSFMV